MNEYRCADPLREPEQWLRHVLEGTRLVDARGRSVPEIKELAGLAGQARTAMDALLVGFASEIDSSGTSASPQKVLQDSARMSKRDANRMAKTAKGLEELPNVKERLASGKISLEHAGLLVNTAKETGPAAVDNNTRLLDRASETPPDLFAGEAKRFAHKVSDDHGEKLFNRQRRRRKAALWKDTESGMGRLNAELDPVRYGLVEQALQDHAEALRRADLAGAGAGGSGQARTREQRLADALTERLTEPYAASTTNRSTAPTTPEPASTTERRGRRPLRHRNRPHTQEESRLRQADNPRTRAAGRIGPSRLAPKAMTPQNSGGCSSSTRRDVHPESHFWLVLAS